MPVRFEPTSRGNAPAALRGQGKRYERLRRVFEHTITSVVVGSPQHEVLMPKICWQV